MIPTVSRFSFGTSIPTSPSPGIGAWIRIDFAFSARVRSFLRASILARRTHLLGRSLYCITVGHTHSSSISTSIPNWRKVFSMRSDFSSISSGDTTLKCWISLRSFRLGKSQVQKSIHLAGCLDSISLPSGVSSGIFFVRLDMAFDKRVFPVLADIESFGITLFLCIRASLRSSSSAFFLYTSSIFHFFTGTISSSSSLGIIASRIRVSDGTDSLTLLSRVRYDIRRVR